MKFGSQEYQDYILGCMTEGTEILKEGDKLIPKVKGLWQVCVREVGLLECETPEWVVPPAIVTRDESFQLSTTVKVRIRLRPYLGGPYPSSREKQEDFKDLQVVSHDEIYTFEGSFTSAHYNVNPGDVFYRFASSTAESIALGRALTRALSLNINTQEEVATDLEQLKEQVLNNNNVASPGTVKPQQINLATKLFHDTEVNPEKYLTEKHGVKAIQEITKKTDIEAILRELHEFKRMPKKAKEWK